MKKLLLLFSTCLAATGAYAQCSELFFSEYLEGTSNNKAIEIYNPTSATINLTNYTIYRYNNGSPSPSDSLFPQGTLAPGAVYVAGNPSAIAAILAVSDTLHTITFFNGDDVMSIKNNTTGLLVDIIGIIGVDPGINWPVGTGATSEFTLVRMVGIQQGNTNWAVAATEYDVYPSNTFTFIGNHSMTSCCIGVWAQLGSSSNVNCYGDSTGTASVSAMGSGLTYSWTPYGGSFATASNLVAGTYTCIVSDPCADADTVTVTITQSAYLDTINVIHTGALCNGDSNGGLSLFGSGGVGPYTYLWSTGDTSHAITGLSAGFYTYTITDAVGCTRTDSMPVLEPPVLTSTFTTVQPSCSGFFNGSATAITAGGNSNCTYLWSTNATTQTINNLPAGTYSCVCTDNNGCTTSFSFVLVSPSAVTATIDTVINPSVCGALDGAINITS
ncbi:MAG TPA: lamin tail domain-containing protein, partial [Bacteroidia bacterium]|nr:lamin tail domain-containing protein [Bacteroidia bacterium]